MFQRYACSLGTFTHMNHTNSRADLHWVATKIETPLCTLMKCNTVAVTLMCCLSCVFLISRFCIKVLFHVERSQNLSELSDIVSATILCFTSRWFHTIPLSEMAFLLSCAKPILSLWLGTTNLYPYCNKTWRPWRGSRKSLVERGNRLFLQ